MTVAALEAFPTSYDAVPTPVATPWSRAPEASACEALASCGGGAFLDAAHVVVWRCAGDVLTVCELALAGPGPGGGNCVALRLASSAPRPGGDDGFARVFRASRARPTALCCVATARHLHVIELGGVAGSLCGAAAVARRVGGAVVDLERLLGGPARPPPYLACWSAPSRCCVPADGPGGGGVVDVRLGASPADASFTVLRDAGGRGALGRLAAAVVGGSPAAADGAGAARVVALASGGDEDCGIEGAVVAALRADWRLSVWLAASGSLHASLDLRRPLRADPRGIRPPVFRGTPSRELFRNSRPPSHRPRFPRFRRGPVGSEGSPRLPRRPERETFPKIRFGAGGRVEPYLETGRDSAQAATRSRRASDRKRACARSGATASAWRPSWTRRPSRSSPSSTSA